MLCRVATPSVANAKKMKDFLVVVKFRGDHTPMVLTGETQEMQERAAPAEESFFQSQRKKDCD